MRRTSVFLDKSTTLELKLTPLIDVIFLLLIFFVWTASFRIAEYVLPSSVSEASEVASGTDLRQPPPPDADFADVVVRVLWTDGRPEWRINDELIARLPDVRSRLSRIHEVNQAAPVVIHPDPDVPLGHVIDLYDVARMVGFAQVQFTADAGARREPMP
jgi:biopolymer transport protein ExbD